MRIVVLSHCASSAVQEYYIIIMILIYLNTAAYDCFPAKYYAARASYWD